MDSRGKPNHPLKRRSAAVVEDPAAARPFAVGFSFSQHAFPPPPPQIPRATNLDVLSDSPATHDFVRRSRA